MMRWAKVFLWGTAGLLLASPVLAQEWVNVPLGRGPEGMEGWKWVPFVHVNARLERVERADGDQPALRVTFSKTGEERRLLALEAQPQGNPAGAKALGLRYRLILLPSISRQAGRPRPVLVVFEEDGGVWFKVSAQPVVTNEFSELRLPLTSLKQAQFSQDPNGALQWNQVEKVWVGLAFDGPAQGTFELSRAYFTSEPYRPSQPLPITGPGPGQWRVIKDPAVQAKVTTPNEGPGGKPCLKFEFTLPGRRHMYALPATSVPEAELEGYCALRFTYRAKLPQGINGLLVTLWERDGSQYYADPPPPASEEWKTVTIPFQSFRLGGWSKDENQRLDLAQINTIVIGLHGTTSEERGSGIIWATDIEFVPVSIPHK